MSLLSDKAMHDLWVTHGVSFDTIRAIEAAVLEAQGKQEPWPFSADRVTYHKAAPVVQPDRRRLHNDIAEVVAKQLHYFDNVEKINGATTAKEVSDVLEGGIDRYRNDAVFHAKVCSLVAHLTQVIAAAEGKSNAEVSGAGTASAGLPGYAVGGNGERK